MQYDRLLADVTGLGPAASQRAKHMKLTAMLQDKHGEDAISLKGVSKWFERGSMPSGWLVRVAALPQPPLDLTTYLEGDSPE